MQELPSSHVELPKKQHKLVANVIDRWRQLGTVDQDTANRLTESISIARFDWQRLARYSFIVALCCTVIAAGAIVADEVLLALLKRIFDSPPLLKSTFLAVLSAGIIRFAVIRKRADRRDSYRIESILFAGALSLAGSIFFLGVALDQGTGHYSVLFLLATIVYLAIGLWFPSKLLWVLGLLSFGTWMGTETGYMSGHGAYFLGMNYPFRFALFGGFMTVLGLLAQHAAAGNGPAPEPRKWLQRLFYVAPQTKVLGLLNFFIALWIMSIFGNYGDMDVWRSAKQYELLHWSVVFGAAAILAVWYGLKMDDGVLRGFGLTFLFINLYTRFFEYFWEATHKAVFFTLLALSFWYLGSRAERIWHLGAHKELTQK